MTKPILVASLCAALSFSNVFAAELGRVELNGRQIIINDDNSWAYADNATQPMPANTNCQAIDSKVLPLSFCLNPNKWSYAEINDVAELQFKVKDKEIYAMVITETDVIPEARLKNAILTNGQNAAGLNKIKVTKEADSSEIGPNFPNFIYEANIDGSLITYNNYYKTFPFKGIVQIIMFSTTNEFEASLPYMDEFISNVTVK